MLMADWQRLGTGNKGLVIIYATTPRHFALLGTVNDTRAGGRWPIRDTFLLRRYSLEAVYSVQEPPPQRDCPLAAPRIEWSGYGHDSGNVGHGQGSPVRRRAEGPERAADRGPSRHPRPGAGTTRLWPGLGPRALVHPSP